MGLRAAWILAAGACVGCTAVAGLDDLSFNATATSSATGGSLGGGGGATSSTSSATTGTGGSPPPECDPGFGDCDGDAANGCEQRLDVPAACGRCGRVCEGTCENELCTPVILTSGLSAPQGVTLVGQEVLVCQFSGDEVSALPKSGGVATTRVGMVDGCAGLHHDQNYLYIAAFNTNELIRAELDGNDPVILYGGDGVHGVEIVNDTLFWTEHNAMFVRSGSSSGSTPAPSILADGTVLSRPTSVTVAADDGTVAFTDFGSGIVWATDGNQLQILGQGYVNPFYITVDDTHYYWTVAARNQPEQGAVYRLARDGSDQPTVVARSTQWPSGIAVDDTHIYFALENSGQVVRVPK